MSKAGFLLLIVLLATGAAADNLSVPVPECVPVFRTQPDGEHITAPGYATAFSPGDPSLPFKEVYVIIPPAADPASVSVALSGESRDILAPSAELAPAPPIVTSVDGEQTADWGAGKRIESGRNALVYGENAFYPANNVSVADIGSLRKWRIVTVRYYPLRYNPVARQIERTASGRISVSWAATPAMSAEAQPLADEVFSDKVQALAANYAEARSWYGSSAANGLSTADLPVRADYVIITTSAIASGSAKLQAFVDHKTSRGFKVEVETETQWGGGAGDLAADNIRAYLQSNYIAKGIRYVLLIGNPHPTSGDVPMKMLWPRYSADTYREAPSDYYYADLTGDWDLNGNGIYGEGDGDFGTGGIDRFPEVIVGRIPFYGDFAALDSILQKTIDYESGALPGAWVRNVLVSVKPSDDITPGYQLGEAIRADAAAPAGMTTSRVYDAAYGLATPPEYSPCTYASVLAAWQQHAGFHFWWTHGSNSLAAEVFNTGNCAYLDDHYPSFTFQASCQNGTPEDSANLGFALLKRGAIATDSATRVSWYRPGESEFANSDSNPGLAYSYAIKLIRDHMPCGDAHYAALDETPNAIWMNHLVYNLYGDPSVKYPLSPIISHKPLGNTDITTQPYQVDAQITASSPLASGSPVVKWNTNGGPSFAILPMTPTANQTYSASIPAQPYGTTVYYYIGAIDTAGLGSSCPYNAPSSLLSFRVKQDAEPPVIVHTPLSDTGNRFGPFAVVATVTDDLALGAVTLHYNVNGGAYKALDMLPQGQNAYEADIPGPALSGDTIGYYITATDTALRPNASRFPSTGSFSFRIAKRVCVAVLNMATIPTYFVGGNMNAWSTVRDLLNADTQRRFQVSVVTTLAAGTGAGSLTDQDVLVLPDNAVPVDSLAAVSDWFRPGKVLLLLDSSVCYAAYTGWMWPTATGTNGYDTCWDYGATLNDQKIWADDPITTGHPIGQIIGSVFGDAEFLVNKLPADARALSGKNSDPTRCYAAYRDVPGKGRLVLLGPYVPIQANQSSIIAEALIAPPQPRQLTILAPNGGESYDVGQSATIRYSATGTWSPADTVTLEYCTGLDTIWRQVPGAEALPYDLGTSAWDTTGLPGSHGYRVRVTQVGGSVSDESDAPFSVIPTVDIPVAKSIPDGGILRLAGKIVTSALPGLTYVEEPDRRAGLRIDYPKTLDISVLADFVGTMGTANGERVLRAEAASPLGAAAQIDPCGIQTDSLGGSAFGLQGATMEYRLVRSSGGYTIQLLPSLGLNNIGLLVRVCGRVTASGVGWFYLDDGAACNDGSGYRGVKVFCPGIATPTVGSFIAMNAISSTYFDRNSLFRALVLPNADALMTLFH